MKIAKRWAAPIVLFGFALGGNAVSAAEPGRENILAAMKSASRFMHETVAVRGGHVWVVEENLERRWGEVPARPSQIWLQGGTERVGQAMLDAYEATLDPYYLGVARDAADAVVYGQTPEGGWHYFIDFDPTGVESWYESTASKFLWGYEEYRHYYGNATYDDHVTPDAAGFLLRFYALTLDPAYRAPLLKALDFVLESQFPNGLWPQRYPLRYDYAHDGFADYTAYFTLNDGASQAATELLLDAWRILGDARYFEAARRAAEGMMAIQGPDGQAAWAEQYGQDGRPAAARTHEPAGYVVRESLDTLRLLMRLYLITGDERYLAPAPRAVDWFERINRESAERRYPRPRYWAPGSNEPVYVVRTDERSPAGYGLYTWTNDPSKTDCDGRPCQGDGKAFVDVEAIRGTLDELRALRTPEARQAYLDELLADEHRRARLPRQQEDLAVVIEALDERGAWLSAGLSVNEPNLDTGADVKQQVTGFSTRLFTDRLQILIAAIEEPD